MNCKASQAFRPASPFETLPNRHRDSYHGACFCLIRNACCCVTCTCVEHVTEPERLHQMNINFRKRDVIETTNRPLRDFGNADAIAFAMMRRFRPRRFYNGLLYRNLPNPKLSLSQS